MKILQIAYHFPPMGGAGVQRALKFARYLPEFGVEPVVLAAHDPGYLQDPGLADELPAGLEVHRIEHRRLVTRALAWRRRLQAAAGPAVRAAAPPRPARLREALLAAHAALAFPDDKAGWSRRACAVGDARLARGDIALVYSSAPPVSAHAVAARLAARHRLPWVADWRDLWTDNPEYRAPGWRRRLDRATETAWFAQAAGVVTVTPSWQRLLAARIASGAVSSAPPVEFIPNGYDEADFGGRPETPIRAAGARRVFRLVHVGTLYGQRSPQALLEAAERLLARAEASAPALRLRFVGAVGERFGALLDAFAARHPGVVERVAYCPHAQAIDEMLAADALLLMVGGGAGASAGSAVAGTLPGKVFEYLRARRPILLVGPERGDAATLVGRHASALVVDEGAPERIAAALAALLAGRLPAPADPQGAAAFERRALAARLAAFLRRCGAATDAR